ncbi:uncharacterized protein LOC119608168 [Lucilia sericata]|uniref:uncharacterized protein LOC119608168 n=1 Tax=Lucilia sericata TaxID=13632 RepID=UPI0018A7FF1C|nr:uncharacterized protein LOC119608168 [Lucilia sericata]
MVIKEEVNEVMRAAQMAKGGIVNSNVLDREEIHRIIDEIATLPYSNELEAIEYADPRVCTNGSMILYVLSLPKTYRLTRCWLMRKRHMASPNHACESTTIPCVRKRA